VAAIVRRPGGLAAACREATVLATPLALRHPCPAPAVVIDRAALARDGGHALWFARDGSVRVETVRAWRGERPWTARR
jgi:competence protein ComEC